MQKIYIKNFGAIKEAEIEIKSLLVLIGEQASGKSTIAKLIYFFKSLNDDFFNQFYKSDKDYLDITSDLIIPIREKYYDFFGSTFYLPEFEIKYCYSEVKWLRLSLYPRTKKLRTEFSRGFLSESLKSDLRNIKTSINKVELKIHVAKSSHEQLALEQEKIKYIQQLSNLINTSFENNHDDALFMIAGRNATVGYSDLFEKYLFTRIQIRLDDNRKQGSFKKKEQTIDETLMLKFMERVIKIKALFEKYGNVEGLISSLPDNARNRESLLLAKMKIDEILKGNYLIDRWGEKILHDNDHYVFLHNASSGQQEVIRILQDIFVVIFEQQKSLRWIEEPEAHLFPVAQKLVIELFALMINQNSSNQLIITTHSPYVLTVINNLLFAKRVIDKNISKKEDVFKIIPEPFLLEPENFNAYSLGNSEVYCESVFNEKTGLIKQSYLDTVSEMLSSDFNNLYSIHAQTFARK
ncbi:MAG: AAA family ATPase [Mariniphaga sp.]